MLVDPSMKEEAACGGSLTVVLNAHNELCLLSKAGGLGLSLSQVAHPATATSILTMVSTEGIQDPLK